MMDDSSQPDYEGWTDHGTALRRKLAARSATIGVIGLGRVGLPLARAFADAGFAVIGIDVDADRVAAINQDRALPVVVSSDEPTHSREGKLAPGELTAIDDYAAVAACDVAVICVPTPRNKTPDPDLRQVLVAGEAIARHMRPGLLVVLESTTPPGTTEDLLLLLLAAAPAFGGGGAVGEDFFLAYAPERLDPGHAAWTLAATPRVVGGVTPLCAELATTLYGQIVSEVVPVSSPTAAEMVKVFENTFRAVNIALANEMTIVCDKLGMDAREILDAAATKPYGFMRFAPGPGIGGQNATMDDSRLAWKLKAQHKSARFLQLATKVNSDMPRYWVEKVQDALNQAGKALRGSRVLLLGVAYKKDTDDLRESPATAMIDLLQAKSAHVAYHDPYVASFVHGGVCWQSETDLEAALRRADCVLIVADHSVYQRYAMALAAGCLVDTRNGVVGQAVAQAAVGRQSPGVWQR